MKIKSYILLAAAAIVLGISSCSDYLEEENKAGQTADLSYSTISGINGLVGGCYSFARGWYGKEPGLGLSEMGTDLFYYGYDNKQKGLNSYSLTSVSLDDDVNNNPCLDQYWEMFYSAVDVCNNAIKYVPKNTLISATTKTRFLGEAYFMRAFYYWHMVNIWGPIPYNSEPITISTLTSAPTRMPEEEVYSNMLSDLDKSIAAFDSAGYKVKTDGRANYWSARGLKARVLLYAASWLGKNSITTNSTYAGQDLYALAQAEAEAVIVNGPASFYTTYSDTWSMVNEDISKNKETIFGISYSSDLTSIANCIPYRYKTDASGNPRTYNSLITRTGYTRGGSAMLLMFVSMWSNGATDVGTKDVFIRSIDAATSYLTNTKTKLSVYVASTYSPYGRGFTRYLPSLYLWNLLDKYRATDQRTNATLLEAYTIAPGMEGSSKIYTSMTDTAIYYCPLHGDSTAGKAKQAWAKGRYRIQFKCGGDIPVYTTNDPATAKPTEVAKLTSDVYGDARFNTYKIGGWCSFPGIKKFLDNVLDVNFLTNDLSYRDAVVMRLAEMYLIKAECQLYTESGTNAMATINQLRAVRAISGKDNTLTGAADIETILQERAIELCGEQQRWFDLKRTKTLVAHVKAYNAQASANITSNHLLRPIPQSQINAITNYSTTEGVGFWQNPGY